jgi:hypothetical protein
MSSFVEFPLLAFLPALAFLLVGWRLHRRNVLGAGAAWLLYGLYELGMRARILCSGECNIRIDLFVLHPLLLAMTLVGVVSAVRGGIETRASR